MLNLEEIKALIFLLGDPDSKIRAVAHNKLLSFGDPIEPILEKVVNSEAEGRIRIEARAILEANRLNQLTEEVSRISCKEEFDLETASLILAQIEYPQLCVSAYSRKFDDLANDAFLHMKWMTNEKKRVEFLGKFLFGSRFQGNDEAYYDPQNSYINRVLDRKLGIPISLSAIYLFVAERLQLPVQGVAFPGHFLLKYDFDSSFFFIDAFNNGAVMSADDCVGLLRKMGYSFYDFYFDPANPRDILARMVRNLVLIYSQNNQLQKIDALERIFSEFFRK